MTSVRRSSRRVVRGVAALACLLLLTSCFLRGGADPSEDPGTTGTATGTSSPPPTGTATRSPGGTASGPVVPGAQYVSPSGSDSADGSETAPWRTLTHAFASLRPGDTLYVRAGVFDEQVRVEPTRGSPSEPVLVAAYPGERPVLRGLLWLTRPSYWTIDGLNVTWSTKNEPDEHMVKITDGVGWTWRRGEVWGARSVAGFLVAGDRRGEPADWALLDSCIHDTQPANGQSEDSNLYLGDMRQAGPGLVEGNLMFNAPNGRNVKVGPGRDSAKRGPDNVVVRYNTLYGAYVPVVVASGSTNNVIERNIIGGSVSGPLVRGFELTGAGNVVRDNIGFDGTEMFAPDNGSLVIGDGNSFRDSAQLTDMGGCDGFVPVAEARGYGHLAAP